MRRTYIARMFSVAMWVLPRVALDFQVEGVFFLFLVERARWEGHGLCDPPKQAHVSRIGSKMLFRIVWGIRMRMGYRHRRCRKGCCTILHLARPFCFYIQLSVDRVTDHVIQELPYGLVLADLFLSYRLPSHFEYLILFASISWRVKVM